MIITHDNYYEVIEANGKKTFMPQSATVFISGDNAGTVVRNTASRKNIAFIID